MEVILRDHVENVGKRGEIVKVADGYARNYLLPRKLALPVTPGNVKHIERERGKLDAKEADEKSGAETIAASMAGVAVIITRRVGETDVLYGSVTTADIAEALKERGYEIDRHRIHLREPLKRLGEYAVPVRLHREVTIDLQVKVLPEGEVIVGRLTPEQEAELARHDADQSDEATSAAE